MSIPNSLAALADDVARIRGFVADALIQRGIPQCGDFPAFADDLTGELIIKVPSILGEVSLATAAGDADAAREAVVVALVALEEVAGSNALFPASEYKVAYRGALRRFITDAGSADAACANSDVTTARREARKIADQLGIDLATCAAEGEELRQADLARAEAAEKARLAKIASDRKKRQFESMKNLGMVDTVFLRGRVSN